MCSRKTSIGKHRGPSDIQTQCPWVLIHTKKCFVSRLNHQHVCNESELQESSKQKFPLGSFLPFWSHSPAQLSNQIYQVKTISKQILTGDYQKRFRLYTAHHKSHFPFFGQESSPDVQASPKLPQSSYRVTLYVTVSDNLKCKKKKGGEDYNDSLYL